MTTLPASLLALVLATPQAADTTITLSGGTRLEVENPLGEIVVDSWERGEVRIQATYDDRNRIRVDRDGTVIRVRAEEGIARQGRVAYRITVPAAMDLELNAVFGQVTVTGSRGQVRASAVNGGVTVRGGTNQVSVESVQGQVTVEGARAAVRARSVNGGIRIRDVTGTVDAQSVSGAVVLEQVQSSQIEAVSVNGTIYYDGEIARGGRYRFVTHNGSVTVAVPQTPDATISVSTQNGSFSSSFPGVPASSSARGRRQSFVLGSGSATVDLETFNGSIRLVRRGEVAPPGRGRADTI